MTTATTPHDPADWSDLSKSEYSGRIIEAKIHGPVGNADYMRQEHPRGHKDYVMSRSEMKNFASNPARWIKGYREGSTDEKNWGSQLDCLIFTPEDFPKRFVVTPATYESKKGAKKWNWNAKACQEFKDGFPGGADFISHAEFLELIKAKRAVMEDDIISELLDASEFQVLVTGTYEDFETAVKVQIKGCVDIVPNRGGPSDTIIADLKTTASVNPNYQDSDVERWWSNAQGSLYLDLFCAAGDERMEFRHVLIENFPPYQVGRRFLSEETMRRGREKYHGAMKLYCQCLKSGKWPSHEEMNDHRACIDGWLATEPILKPT